MQKEVWRTIEGYDNVYRVSNKGNFESCMNVGKHEKDNIWRRRKIHVRKNGYYVVSLTKNGKRNLLYIHRLVAESFIPNPDNKPQIDHIDGNKSNNHVFNLRWCTATENLSNINTKQKRLEIAERKGISVSQYTISGEFVREFYSLREVERTHPNISRTRVKKCAEGLIESVCGYVWKFSKKDKEVFLP